MPTILLAEDDDSIRNTIGFAFSHSGFEVTPARSGGEVLELVKEHEFDVLLLDMLMMGGSGMDFLRTYDVKRLRPKMKVIALTNFSNPSIEEEARKLGVTEYLLKADYEPPTLVELVKKMLPDGKDEATPRKG